MLAVPQLAFRPLEAPDVAAISLVHRRACLIAYRFMNWSYALDEVEAWYSRKFAGWNWTLAASVGDSDIVGFIALTGRHVDQLFVDPSHQRSGVGSTLLAQAHAYILGPTTLHVFEENRSARAFYEKYGYREHDRWLKAEEGAINLLYVRG